MKRYQALILLFVFTVFLAACDTTATYTPLTPQQRLENAINYCRRDAVSYAQFAARTNQGGFWQNYERSQFMATYERRCSGITIAPLLNYETLYNQFAYGNRY